MKCVPGLLITGGQGAATKVRVVNPRSEQLCELPDLPDERTAHTFCGQLLCGGLSSERSCLKFDGENFTRAEVFLVEARRYHLCWSVGEDVMLLGGDKSDKTTEIVKSDGSFSSPSFELRHSVRWEREDESCIIIN